MAKASDNKFPKIIVTEGTAPSSPAAGDQILFVDSADHILKRKNSAGAVTSVEAAGGGAYTQGAKVYNNAALTLPNAGVLLLTFNSEYFDTDTCHSTVTNTDRLTATTAGKYICGAHGLFSSALGGSSGSWIEHNTKGRIVQQDSGGKTSFEMTTIVDMAAGDYIFVKIYNISGTPTVNYSGANEYSPTFWMQKIG